MRMAPIVHVLDGEADFEALFRATASLRHTVRLQGGWDAAGLGRFSFLGFDPYAAVWAYGRQLFFWDGRRTRRLRTNPWSYLGRLYEVVRSRPFSEKLPSPFQGGAMGYLGYELMAASAMAAPSRILPVPAPAALGMPDLYFPFFDVFLVYDHFLAQCFLVSTGLPLTGGEGRQRAVQRLAQAKESVAAARKEARRPAVSAARSSARSSGADGWRSVLAERHSSFSQEAYTAAVQKVIGAIEAEELYQVNLAQRFTVPVSATPAELFERLRRINPAPFGAFIQGERWAVVSVSPERFLRYDGRHLETRPIKGTRARGKDEAEDQALRMDLLASEKDRAEHAMIVDLERDELSSLCRIGTVSTPELMACERHPTVWHLVSTITGRPKDPRQVIPAIQRLAPTGSITGAPKRRVMEYIAALEPVPRGVYTGSIGYLGVGGRIDLNVAIRTVCLTGGVAHFHVGGGIVVDSDPESEYQETLEKGRAIADALGASP